MGHQPTPPPGNHVEGSSYHLFTEQHLSAQSRVLASQRRWWPVWQEERQLQGAEACSP